MILDFRCERCGKLLSVEAAPGATVRCHHCRAKVTVPAALASLPTPQVPAPRPLAPAPAVTGAAAPAEPEQEAEQSEAATGKVGKVVPWAMSLVLHLAIILILSFIVLFIQETTAPQTMVFADATLSEDPGGVLNPGAADPNLKAAQDRMQTLDDQWSKTESELPLDSLNDQTDKVRLIGISGGGAAGGDLAEFGLTTGGSGSGPQSNFYGTGGNAHHIVFVVDASGSMYDSLDYVKAEMAKSIGRLTASQNFHIIFFVNGPPDELPAGRLVPVTPDNARAAAKYLADVRAGGAPTNPIPALQKAFAVLKSADPSKPGKLIFLLTDGDFADNEAVLAALRELNRAKEVAVNTYLYQHRIPEMEKILQRIAEENGGRYAFVSDY